MLATISPFYDLIITSRGPARKIGGRAFSRPERSAMGGNKLDLLVMKLLGLSLF
jgi:hypothetical protein